MKHDPATVVEFARGAGFPRSILAATAAIAMATSGGFDDYEAHAGIPGAGHWKGLWGIDTDRHPEYDGFDLFDPRVAADVTKHLTAATGSFAWSTPWVTGQCRPYHETCTLAVAMPPYQEREHVTNRLLAHELAGSYRPRH